MFCRPFDPSARIALLLLNTWSFFTGLAAFFLYWILSMAGTGAIDEGLAAEISRLDDVGLLRQMAVSLLSAAVDFRQSGMTLAVWGLSLLLLSSGLSLLLLFREMRRPVLSGGVTEKESQGFRADLLHGRVPLWKAFWLVYVPQPLVTGLVVMLLLRNLDGKTQIVPSLFAFPLSIGLMWTVLLSVTVLVWRCSENVARPIWGKLVRVLLVLVIAVPLLRMLIGMLPFLGLISRS
jgi:hypothetical protein